MRDYELLYITSGDKSEDDAAKVTDAVNASLLKAGGKVEDENFWGRRKLAYPISKQDHGWYIVTKFSLASDKLAELGKELNLNQSVIRSLILAASEVPTAEEASRIEEAVKAEETEETKKGAKPVPTPETVKKTPAKTPKKVADKKPAKKETATEKKERQAKLEEKLSEILKDE